MAQTQQDHQAIASLARTAPDFRPGLRGFASARVRALDSAIRPRWLDRLGMAISGLCLVHCVATAIIVSLLSTAGSWLGSPLIHEGGLVIAIIFGALALAKGIIEHGYLQPAAFGGLGLGIMAGALTIPHGDAELVYTLFGVSLVALGHDLNIRASSRLR